jgi:diguanylate cyclase (GGDEF)-like protein/PAS domain S-box-containing protein
LDKENARAFHFLSSAAMISATLPANEVDRIAALRALGILDSPAEVEFDALVKVAASACDVPMGLISLVDTDRQWFKAHVGLGNLHETARDISFCSHAIHGDAIFEVPDARADARFSDNPLVLQNPGICFYAGAPIRLSSGQLVGTLCVMDHAPRQLTATQRDILAQLSFVLAKMLETRASLIAWFEQQRSLQDILDGTDAGTWDWDMNSGQLRVNERWAQITGRTLQDFQAVTYDTWKALVHPDDYPHTEVAVAEHLAGKAPRYGCEFRLLHSDGHWIWVHSSGQVKAWNPDGTARRMFGTYLDISDRKRAQQQLIESESNQRRLYEATPAMLYSINAQGALLSVSNWFAEKLGYSREEMIGQKPTAFMTAESARYALDTVFKQFLQTGSIRDIPYQWIRRNGEVMDTLVSAELERDAHGNPLRSLSVVNDVTERQRISRQLDEERLRLANSEAHLRAVINSVPGLIAFVDANERYVYANQQFLERFAPKDKDLIGSTVREVLGKERYAVVASFVAQALSGHTQTYDWQPFPDLCLLINYQPTFDAQNRVTGYYVLATDITERQRIETALRESEQRLARVLDGANQGYWDWNLKTNAFQVSARWETMLGYQPGEMLKDPADWPLLVHPEDLPLFMASIDRHMSGLTHQHEVELRVKTKEGAWLWILTSGRIVSWDASGAPLMMSGTHTDISQIKAHEAELDRVANFDPLTLLPNRRLLSDRLKQLILRSDRSGKSTAICFLDLDGFKIVNDQFGHAVGDQVLIGISRHLSAVLRADDTLARLGGDEFVLLLAEIETAEECVHILERILEATRLPIEADGQTIALSASIGVSLYPSDNADSDILLRHADMAMYMAKQAGKNRYQMFDTEIDRIAQGHRDFLDQMEIALLGREFVLYYQPQVDLQSGLVIGAEALIRWCSPTSGLLAPSAFLPSLNGSYLEGWLGEWVIASALQQLREWKALGLELKVSVNISANHLLQPDFSTRLGQALARYPDIDASNLELEVLETAAIGDMQHAVEILQSCMALGVRFALDDFGTGYSSLTYLRKLPVHTLKIDQSFVRDMLIDPDDLGIVRGIIELASAFGRQVVAEGVETMEHGAALRGLGCYRVQGYGIAKPMPASQFPAWCDTWLNTGWSR